MKLFCVDKNLNELSCSVSASVINQEKINEDIIKYTLRFENKGEEISCIPTVEIRRQGELNFYMIPCVNYNGNDFGDVIEPKKMRYESKPWVFPSDRVGVPGCTVSETQDLSVSLFAGNDNASKNCSCSIFDDCEETVHRIYFSHVESPVSYLMKYKFSNAFIEDITLKTNEKVEYVCYIYRHDKKNEYYGFNNLLDFINSSYAIVRKPRFAMEKVKEWNKKFQDRQKEQTLSYTLFNMGFLPDGEHKIGSENCKWQWRKGGRFGAGWCGQNYSIAELYLRYYKETGDGYYKNTALAVLDTWLTRTHENGLVSAYFDCEFCDSEDIDTCNEGWILYETLLCAKLLKEDGDDVTKYERSALGICDFFIKNFKEGGFPQILSGDGKIKVKDGAAGAMLLFAFCEAYDYFKKPELLEKCNTALEFYWESYLKKAVSVGGALDTYCVDKESCHPFLCATLKLFEITGEKHYLDKAQNLAHYLMSWTFYHDINFDKNSDCAKIDLKTTGATSVSASHHHLDAYGVVYVPEMLKLYALTKNSAYLNHAKILWNFVTEFISDGSLVMHGMQRWEGMQNEGVFNCRWGFGDPNMKGHLNDWMVSWVKVYEQKTIFYMQENNISFD